MDIDEQLNDPLFAAILALVYAAGGDPDTVEEEMEALHTKIMDGEFTSDTPQSAS